jgi:hypothetical protein
VPPVVTPVETLPSSGGVAPWVVVVVVLILLVIIVFTVRWYSTTSKFRIAAAESKVKEADTKRSELQSERDTLAAEAKHLSNANEALSVDIESLLAQQQGDEEQIEYSHSSVDSELNNVPTRYVSDDEAEEDEQSIISDDEEEEDDKGRTNLDATFRNQRRERQRKLQVGVR